MDHADVQPGADHRSWLVGLPTDRQRARPRLPRVGGVSRRQHCSCWWPEQSPTALTAGASRLWGRWRTSIVALALAWYVRFRPGELSTTPIFLLVLAFGAGQAFAFPGVASPCPPPWSPNEGVPWLVARRSVASQTGTIIGPVLAGLLYGAGVWVPLVAAAALSFTAGAALVMAIRVLERATVASSTGRGHLGSDDQVSRVLEEGSPAQRGGLHEAMEGLRFVRSQSIVLGAISLDLFAVLFGGAVTLLPAIAVRLHVGRALGLGWLRAAAGLGAGSMTLLIAFRPVPGGARGPGTAGGGERSLACGPSSLVSPAPSRWRSWPCSAYLRLTQ